MSLAARCTCGKSPYYCNDSIKECRNRVVNLGGFSLMSNTEISQFLFEHHTHPDMLDTEPGSLEVVYKHEDIIKLLQKLGIQL